MSPVGPGSGRDLHPSEDYWGLAGVEGACIM